jgi:hypothetical protein
MSDSNDEVEVTMEDHKRILEIEKIVLECHDEIHTLIASKMPKEWPNEDKVSVICSVCLALNRSAALVMQAVGIESMYFIPQKQVRQSEEIVDLEQKYNPPPLEGPVA